MYTMCWWLFLARHNQGQSLPIATLADHSLMAAFFFFWHCLGCSLLSGSKSLFVTRSKNVSELRFSLHSVKALKFHQQCQVITNVGHITLQASSAHPLQKKKKNQSDSLLTSVTYVQRGDDKYYWPAGWKQLMLWHLQPMRTHHPRMVIKTPTAAVSFCPALFPLLCILPSRWEDHDSFMFFISDQNCQ